MISPPNSYFINKKRHFRYPQSAFALFANYHRKNIFVNPLPEKILFFFQKNH